MKMSKCENAMKMYKKPETETISVQTTTSLLSGSQTVEFGTGKGTGPALAPARPVDYQHTNL
jgi:hypothetical protein